MPSVIKNQTMARILSIGVRAQDFFCGGCWVRNLPDERKNRVIRGLLPGFSTTKHQIVYNVY